MKTSYAHFFLVFALAACGGSKADVLGSSSGTSGGSSGTSGGSSGTSGGSSGASGGSSGTGLPAVSCGSDNVSTISGTWSLVTTRTSGGGGNTAQLTIDGSTFAFSSGAQSLTFTATGGVTSLLWQDGGRQAPINSQHTGSSTLAGGLVPLALGGQWSFASQSGPETCVGSLSPTAFNGSCNHVYTTTQIGTLDGSLIADRTSQATSIFGDLGGTWHMTSNQGTTIDSSFVDNTFSAKVTGQSSSSAVTIKICTDSLAGITSSGFEIAGTRR